MNFKILAKGATHLTVKRFLGPFWIRRRWLKKTQWLNREQLEQIQLELLRKLVRHCYDTVPFYRRIMDERAITVKSIQTLDDIKQFPILDKKQVLAAGDTIVSEKYPKWMMTTGLTGGTTGSPLSLPRSLFSVSNEHAFVRRQWDWAGIGFMDQTAYLSGRVIVDADRSRGPLYAYDPFMMELILSNYHLSPKMVPQFVEAMKRYRVKAIIGYPSSIYFLAKSCLDLGLEIKLEAALTTSETIDDVMRQTITRAFGCKIFDFYGAAERVCYIFTCERGSYHVISEYGYTEFMPANSDEKNHRRLVATGFWNYGTPLIRYDIGDTAITSDKICSCGRVFPVVESISGRSGEFVRTPSGKEYAPTLLARVAKGANNILESQIVQDQIDHITVRYVPGKQFTDKDHKHFLEHMLCHLPSELKIDLECVDTIERTKSGKFRFIVSKI
ncbi:MAG: hypothetical protein AMJ43_07420 [Coxiella sp. DG_40]|nr:MAG: hypothetical protein AMJ43_07420 [Coxiella sp. DG_40]